MRSWIFYSISVAMLFLVGTTSASSCVSVQDKESKRILIINSYGEQTTWSRNVVDSLGNKILKVHPGWLVYSGDLKTETAVYSNAAVFTLRSILWGYAERTKTTVDATDLSIASLFVQDDVPDAIVWIGEEGFMNYISYILQLGKWKEIPMVLCGVNDSVSADGWYPQNGFHFDRKCGIREYNTVTKYLPAGHSLVEELKNDSSIQFSKTIQDGAPAYRFDFKLNYSGNIVKLPIRQNLELIKKLMPDLRELICVDGGSYRSIVTSMEVEKALKKIMPDVKYTKIVHNRMNTDSIYDVMLEPVKYRAFLSYSWNINGLYSRRSDKEIDSLFTHVATVPLFTLTERNFNNNNFWVGGCYLKQPEAVGLSVAMLERAVRGDSIMALPFDTLSEYNTILNRTALERYGLTRTADELEDTLFVNIPPSFYQRYEKQLLVSILVLALVGGYMFISWRRNRYNRKLKSDYARYKRLYDKLQLIYENSSIDFALYDGNGKRLHRILNGKVETTEEDSGLFLDDLFESPYLSDDLKEQICSKRAVNCEVSLDFAGKPSRTSFAKNDVYRLIVKPLHEVDYDNACFIAIAINLTPTIRERQEKERFEGLFRFACDSSQVGVVFYDANTAIGMATDSWCKNMNEVYVPGNFPTYKQVVGKDRESLLEYRKAICAGEVQEPFCQDIRVQGNDGEKHWIRQHIYFIQSSNRLVELSLDIDGQKRNEQNLEEAKRKAEEANEESRTFLNSICHEVRTPLNSIVGFSMILSVLDDVESQNDYTSIIMRNVRLLDALIKNILDLSALDGGKVSFNYTRINVADVFIDMEAYIHKNLDNYSLEIIRELPEIEEDRFLTTDHDYLCVILCNLLSNAVKFTKEGSITLGYRKEEDRFYFYITDTGCGIAPEEQRNIFNRFVKLDEYSQGTGLGLALCRSIVKHLGGEIGVTSEKGKGSTFWFALPDKKVMNR